MCCVVAQPRWPDNSPLPSSPPVFPNATPSISAMASVEFGFSNSPHGSTSWQLVNAAILRAKRLGRRMSTVRAIEWLLLDTLIHHVDPRNEILGGEAGWEFSLRHLARMLGGYPLAESASGKTLYDPAGVLTGAVNEGEARRFRKLWKPVQPVLDPEEIIGDPEDYCPFPGPACEPFVDRANWPSWSFAPDELA